MMIRVYLIEDHVTVIEASLRNLFRPHRDQIIVTGSCTSVEIAIHEADPKDFDLFILDLFLEGGDPVENFRKLKNTFPDKPVAIFTSEKSYHWKSIMEQEGANTYITKDAVRSEIKKGIEQAAAGHYVIELPPDGQNHRPALVNPNETVNLLPREKEILRMISNGKTHKEIAELLGISESMIDKKLKVLRDKVSANNTTELINSLIKSGQL
jgi:two-component system response regulator NreC